MKVVVEGRSGLKSFRKVARSFYWIQILFNQFLAISQRPHTVFAFCPENAATPMLDFVDELTCVVGILYKV